MKRIIRLLLRSIGILAVLTASSPSLISLAYGGLWLQSGVSMSRVVENSGGEAADVATTQAFTSSTAGFWFLQGFGFGAQYLNARNSNSGDNSWSLGPKGGLLLGGFELTAAYLPLAQAKIGEIKRTGGGFAVNVGHSWKLFGPVRAGLLGTYWSVTYTNENGEKLASRPTTSTFAPQLSLGFQF